MIDSTRLDLLRALGPDDGWGLLPAVVKAFLAEAPEQQAAIRAAASDGDSDALAAAAHKLKGAASNLGAVTVAKLCGDLEATARVGKTRADDAVLAELQQQMRLAETALAGAIAARS